MLEGQTEEGSEGCQREQGGSPESTDVVAVVFLKIDSNTYRCTTLRNPWSRLNNKGGKSAHGWYPAEGNCCYFCQNEKPTKDTKQIEPPTETSNEETSSMQEETELNGHEHKVCKGPLYPGVVSSQKEREREKIPNRPHLARKPIACFLQRMAFWFVILLACSPLLHLSSTLIWL